MSKQCRICTENVGRKKPGIQCSGFCERFFHGDCLGFGSKQLDSLRVDGITWKCNDCRSTESHSRYSLTAAATMDTASPLTTKQQKQDVRSRSDDSLTGDNVSNRDLLAAMDNMTKELRAFREQQVVLSNSVSFCSDKVSDSEEKLNKINEWMRATDKLLKENTKLKTDIANLESKVNDLDQAGRLNNIEIQGIPEKANENLNTIVQKICNYIEFETTPDKIEYIHRVQLNKNSTNKIKNIILRFGSRNEKEKCLAAAKQKRMKRDNGSSKMEIEGVSDNFFINEHLTLHNKILYKEARLAAKQNKYKYSWTKNGMVFIRRDDTSRIIHIYQPNSWYFDSMLFLLEHCSIRKSFDTLNQSEADYSSSTIDDATQIDDTSQIDDATQIDDESQIDYGNGDPEADENSEIITLEYNQVLFAEESSEILYPSSDIQGLVFCRQSNAHHGTCRGCSKLARSGATITQKNSQTAHKKKSILNVNNQQMTATEKPESNQLRGITPKQVPNGLNLALDVMDKNENSVAPGDRIEE
ncbi:unnamed protein product [Phaedon cochleariae]|uniref:PHD-type domain-containing protein n=1 Tax=Phaedon cochleariae TaxID=80249 RepID=A0A9N9X435_PHACE|nr:unnamed protein product [Phaedon cochleariae]